MADHVEFFTKTLPAKFEAEPNLKDIGASFAFNIDGGTSYTINLAESSVTEGAGAADCTINVGKDDFEALLDNPGMAMPLFMQGKLTADNLGLATQLQTLLG
ncbi:MAG: SCP2 sterol-binding domain-containing protein [Myxococcota bacterium]|nr:SCP2 sterol-binding domain-containing protein [Myxococcota bacterium]